MNPDNPVVKLCTEGMQAEAQGRPDVARDLFLQAWTSSTDDYEACIAAHYVARHQPTPVETLHWNLESLTRAEHVGDDRVAGFYPSLYLNMAYSYELSGNDAEAIRYYDMAEASAEDLPDGRYADIVRYGIAEGKKRVTK